MNIEGYENERFVCFSSEHDCRIHQYLMVTSMSCDRLAQQPMIPHLIVSNLLSQIWMAMFLHACLFSIEDFYDMNLGTGPALSSAPLLWCESCPFIVVHSTFILITLHSALYILPNKTTKEFEALPEFSSEIRQINFHTL